jgi:hypothetical protein
MKDTLEKEYTYFKTHLDEFIKDHPNQFVVIIGERVLGFYPNLTDALKETVKDHKPGTFFVELCTPDKDYYNTILINWTVA